MSFDSMIAEIRGSVPKVPIDAAEQWVQRAWTDLRKRNLWSFQLFEGQWISPPLFNTGTVSVTQGSNVATLDSAAAAALATVAANQPYSFITQRQFRIGQSGIYNIWGWDGNTQLILDRGYGEGTLTSSPFQIYQCYYVPSRNAGVFPVYMGDLRTWISVRNMTTFTDLHTSRMNRAAVDAQDPIRYNLLWPTDVIPYQTDQNPSSPTFGMMMYELWGAPQSTYAFQLLGVRLGDDLSDLNPNLPSAIGEDCITAKARFYAYEWAEANRDLSPRSQSPDYRFLMGAAQKQYLDLMQQYRKDDRERVDNWFSIRRSTMASLTGPVYNSLAGVAFPGAAFGGDNR